MVLFPNYRVRTAARAHPFARDAHGQPIATGTPTWSDAHPGSLKERPGFDPNRGVEWSMRLDVAHWPLEDDDLVMVEPLDEDGPAGVADDRVWVIKDVELVKIEHPGTELVWFVKATGVLQSPEVP